MRETAVWISRRSFLLGALATSGCAVVGQKLGGTESEFGSSINLGPIEEMDAALTGSPMVYVPQARAYIVAVPPEWREPLKEATEANLHAGIDEGYAALFQTCTHLGCRVPECVASGQFECPCHGSLYGPLGEKRGGPAPRGMDRFETSVEDGELWVHTGTVIPGTPIGTDLGTPVEAGCVDGAELG